MGCLKLIYQEEKSTLRVLKNTFTSSYRYGFNGQEQDDEIKGHGNSVNFSARVHDPRLGRFLSIDPIAANFPHNSPYAFSENRVIDMIELEGREIAPPSYYMKKEKPILFGYSSALGDTWNCK